MQRWSRTASWAFSSLLHSGWSGHPAPTAIDAASRALVRGVDSSPLRELAGAAADMNVFGLGALIDAQ